MFDLKSSTRVRAKKKEKKKICSLIKCLGSENEQQRESSRKFKINTIQYNRILVGADCGILYSNAWSALNH